MAIPKSKHSVSPYIQKMHNKITYQLMLVHMWKRRAQQTGIPPGFQEEHNKKIERLTINAVFE